MDPGYIFFEALLDLLKRFIYESEDSGGSGGYVAILGDEIIHFVQMYETLEATHAES